MCPTASTRTRAIPPGEPCQALADCAPGHVCLGNVNEVVVPCESSACCSPYCDVNLGDAVCAVLPGTVCTSFFEQGMAPPGYDHVGVCTTQP